MFQIYRSGYLKAVAERSVKLAESQQVTELSCLPCQAGQFGNLLICSNLRGTGLCQLQRKGDEVLDAEAFRTKFEDGIGYELCELIF